MMNLLNDKINMNIKYCFSLFIKSTRINQIIHI